MKKFTKAKIIIGVILFCILYTILFKWTKTGNPFQSESILYGILVILNIFITGTIGYYVFKQSVEKSSEQIKKTIINSFIWFLLASIVISLSLVGLGNYLFYLIKGLDTNNFATHFFQVELPDAGKQFSVWMLIVSVFIFYMIWQNAIERETKLREENLIYKYKNLKNQLNPHFLFNSLNTLSEIIYTDTAQADNYIQKMSSIYRYLLDHEDVNSVLLEDELQFVKQYFDLQNERVQGKVRLTIEVNHPEQYTIIPVSLQVLIENVFKHNQMSESNPLIINIYQENDYMVVSNTIQKKNTLNTSTQTGLSNLAERVRLIMKKEMIVSKSNDLFTVKLPIIKAKP